VLAVSELICVCIELVTPDTYPNSVAVTDVDVSCLLLFAINAVFGERLETDKVAEFVRPFTSKAQEILGSVPIPILLFDIDRTGVTLELCKREVVV
jgi:hypothetical protein